MRSLFIIGATLAAYAAAAMLPPEGHNRLPPWVAKLLGR